MPTTTSDIASPATTSRQRDADLVARAIDGNPTAFEEIMRQHNRLLFRSVRGVVSDDASAQDLVQDTYLRAFSALGSFRGECALGTWLARIAIRLALDHQRKAGRLVALDAVPGRDTTVPMGSLMMSSASPVEPPESLANRAQLRDILQIAIESLPPIYRSVFILRAVEEMSVNDTALSLQVSADVVKTRYLRARALLRDALGSQIEAHAADVYAFAGERCDAVVSHVLSVLHREGRLRGDKPG